MATGDREAWLALDHVKPRGTSCAPCRGPAGALRRLPLLMESSPSPAGAGPAGAPVRVSLRVGAVVPTYDGRNWLEGCLRSLRDQEWPFSEIVVVDDASSDGTADWLAEAWPGVRVVALERNRGFAVAANRGVAAVSPDCDAVALVNNDVELAPDWLGRTAAVLEAHPEAAAVACKMVRPAPTPRCCTTPATCSAATASASSAGASSATTVASTRPARCSARVPEPRSTGAKRWRRLEASTSATGPTWRTWTWRFDCGSPGGAAATSRRSRATPVRASSAGGLCAPDRLRWSSATPSCCGQVAFPLRWWLRPRRVPPARAGPGTRCSSGACWSSLEERRGARWCRFCRARRSLRRGARADPGPDSQRPCRRRPSGRGRPPWLSLPGAPGS